MQETTLRKIPSWSDMVSSDEWKSADAATRNEVRVKWLTDLARLRRYGFVSGSDEELASFARKSGFDAGQVMFAFNQANADMIEGGVNEGGGLGQALQGQARDDMPFYLPEPGGFAYDMSKAVESGANQSISGVMGLADMATGGQVDGLHEASQRIFRANRDMMSKVNTSVTKGFQDGGVAGAARALALSLGEQVAQQGIQMAIGAATGGAGGLAAMGAIAAGNSWNKASEDDGLSGWKVGAKVAVDTAAEVLSEVFELPILKRMSRTGLRTFVRELSGGKAKDAIVGAVKQTLSAGGLEGFGEAWGQTVQYLGEQYLKDRPIDGKELATQMADAGITGFAMGAGLHATGRASQNASDLKGASRGSFERMLGTKELPEKYRTQRQRLEALDANIRTAEPITIGRPTDVERVIEKRRWLDWYETLNEESRKEFSETRDGIASQVEELESSSTVRHEAENALWRLEQFLDDYDTYSTEAQDAYASQVERAREQADALRRAFPGLEPVEPVMQKPNAEEKPIEPPEAEEPPKVEEPKVEKPVEPPKPEPPKPEPLPVKDDDVRHRNIETREYTPDEGDESLPANVLEAKRAGRVAKVVNPDGSDAGEMFVAVVDAAQDGGDIKVSGDRGYTNEELQNRTEAGARDMQVREIGEDIRPEKLMLYGETNSGTPIVGGEDMHVESGNGRVKALRYAYGHGKAQQYLEAIRREAERLGIPFPEKARMPVLVRVTMGKRTQEQRMDMVNKANAQTGQLGMSDTEQAYSDAKSIARHPGGVWSLFSGSRVNSMFSGANREFLVKVHELIGKRPDDIDEKMQWSESFEKRVTNAMLASLASNIEGFNAGLARQLIDEAPGTVNVKRGLAQTAPMVLRLSETMPDKNILPELGEALTHFVKYIGEKNRNGIKVNEYLGQMTLGFEGEDRNDSPKMSKTAERIFRFMVRAKSQKQVRDFIDAYVDRAKRNGENQSFLLKDMTGATKDEIVEDAIAAADRRDGDSGTNASMSDSGLASIEVPLVEGARMGDGTIGSKAEERSADTNHERVASFARDAETRFPSVGFKAVHDLSELDDDVRSRVEDDARRQGIDVSRADAMMTLDANGRPLCVLVSGNLSGELSRQKIEHEVIGHYGLRMAFGRKFDGLLDAIHRDLGERIERELGQSGYAGVHDMASDQSRRDAAEEWLCQQAEKGTTLWSRLAGRIRRWLRNMGFEMKFTDADIADMLMRGRKAAESTDGASQEVGAKFSLIKDKELLKRLNSEETVKVYRAMQVIGGKLYSPMSVNLVNESSKLKVQARPIELGEWEQADEHPDVIKDYVHDKKRNVTYGRTHIDKGPQDGGGLTPVAYNPYIHASYSPLNDQFKGAWNRPNLVTVEVEVPKSELTSGYWAKGAKNHVGETKWLDGVVSRQLPEGRERVVVLSRYDRPLRIVPDDEVALKIRDFLDGVDVEIPENTVTPSLRDELEKVGVRIGPPEKGNARKKTQDELDRLKKSGDRWAERNATKFSIMPNEPDTSETTAAKGRAMSRRILAPDAVTPITDERILNLPALTELAVALTNGNLTAVERIRMRGGFAEGVTRTNGQMAAIQVIRELARYPQLGGAITVPEGLVSRQARLAMESFVEHGIPREQIRMTSTPDGEGNVTLVFTWEDKDMLRLRKVLAHEIGHVVDWTAGHTMRHNNILARVAGLVKKYLKHEIGETERTMDDLTTRKDVLRLAREARKNILPVRQAQGIKAKSPEGRKLFKDELARLIENESVKSGRFRRDVILDELRSLSKWWRGDFEDGDRYREKPAELYADFVSVLLTRPESVIRERAPEVWRMVQNWKDNRKIFTVEWERLQKEMDGDYAEQNDRLLRQLVESFDRADEMLAEHNSLPKPKATAREIARKAADYVASLVQDRWHTLYRLSREDMERTGKEYRNTLASTIDAYLHSSSAEAYARDFISLWNRTQASHGLTQDEIGTFLLLRRIENDKTLAQRINTYGITPADATRLLEELRRRVGEEKWSDMEEFHRDYWGMRQRAIAKLTGSEAYSEELNEKMWDNEWYATRKTLSHVLPKSALVGIGNGPSARIHAVKGSFEGTSNPMTETVLNDIRLMEGATLNRIKMQTVDLLKNVPEAAVRVNDLKSETPNGFTRVKLWRSGRFESWDIDDVYAGGLRNILDGKMTSAAVKWLSAINNVWRRGLTNYSPSFMLKNPLRDFDETFKNLPKSRGDVVDDLISWSDSWLKGMGESFRYEFKGHSRSGIVERMMWDDYFIPGERVFYDSVEVRTQMDKLAKMAGEPTANTTTPEGVKGAIMKVMEVVGKLSSALERGTKVGGEMWLQENTNLPMEERRSIVQRRVGSPDFARGGQLTPITNNLLIFSNAIIQGYAASYDAIRGDWRTFVKRWMLTDGTMTLLSSLAASGLLLRAWKAASGDDKEETAMSRMLAWLKRAYGNVSLYNLYNYIILPLWETDKGETVFLRFPMGDQSKTMSKMFRSVLDAAMTDRVMSQSLTDQLSKVFKDDFLFSPQPAVAGMSDILTMLGGNNPRDEYHDRPAVNSTQWNAGGWEKAKGVAAYLAGTYLPTSLIPSRIDDNLAVRAAGQATGLSAYIQLSDYGKREQEDAMVTIAAKWRAKVKLEIRRHIDGGGKGFPDMGDELNGMMRKNPWLRQYAIQVYRSLAREKARREWGVRRRSPVRKVVE